MFVFSSFGKNVVTVCVCVHIFSVYLYLFGLFPIETLCSLANAKSCCMDLVFCVFWAVLCADMFLF